MNTEIRPASPPAFPLSAALNDIETAQLIRDDEGNDRRYEFRHALVQDTAYASLMRHDRRRLHRLVAQALEKTYAHNLDELAPRLAEHFDQAGETARALHYYERAAELAAAHYANREALAFYTQALDAARELKTDTRDTLLRARGVIYERIGNFEAARADLENALAVAREEHDDFAEWQSLMDLGFAWVARDYGRAGEYFEEALELARASSDNRRIAHSLNRIGNWYMNHEDVQRARTAHQDALAIFQRIADTRGLADTLNLLGMTGLISGDFRSGFEHFHQAIDLYQTLGDRRGMAEGWISTYLQNASLQSDALVLPPGTDSPADGLVQLPSLVQELGWRAGEAMALWILGEGFAGSGDYGRALELEEKAISLATEIGHQQWLSAAIMMRGAILADLLDYQAAQPDLEHALKLAYEMGSLHWTRVGTGYLASTLIAQAELTRAQETLDRHVPESLPAVTLGQRQSWTARVELALARQDTERAMNTLDHLLKYAANLTSDAVIPRLWMLRAEAYLQMAQPTKAEKFLLAARANLAQRQQDRLLWRVECVLAQVYRVQNRAADTAQAEQIARELIDRLAATVPEPTRRQTFVRRANAMLEARPT